MLSLTALRRGALYLQASAMTNEPDEPKAEWRWADWEEAKKNPDGGRAWFNERLNLPPSVEAFLADPERWCRYPPSTRKITGCSAIHKLLHLYPARSEPQEPPPRGVPLRLVYSREEPPIGKKDRFPS